jgi:hypothetical protein
MILRDKNIENNKGVKNIEDLTQEDKLRYEEILLQLKEALSINNFAFFKIVDDSLISMGMGLPKKVELNSLSETLQNEINWLKTL